MFEQWPQLASELLFSYGLSALISVVIVIIGRWLVRALTSLVRHAMVRAKVDDTLTNFTTNLLYYLGWAVVILTAMANVGISTTSVVAVLGAGAVAVGLALKDSLSNFAAGVMIVFFRPFEVGDVVEVAGVTGTVATVQIFNTVLNTSDNKRAIVPNGQILAGTIINFNVNGTRRVDMVFGISYEDDIRRAKQILEEIVAAESRILPEPAPTIRLFELGNDSVNFAVRPFVQPQDYWDVLTNITEQVKIRFDEAGLTIPYPQRHLHVYQHVVEEKPAS